MEETASNRSAPATSSRRLFIFYVLSAGIIYAAYVVADPTGPDSINNLGSERGNISNNAASVQAQAGNVTNINIEATSITKAWQGYYGNITGTLTLENSAGNVFYNWSGLGSISGEVYASRDDAVSWPTVNCSNDTIISNENNFLGKDASDPDSVNRTFNSNTHPSFLIGTNTITTDSCSSTNAYVDTGTTTTNFYQILLADGDGDMIYTTLIDENTVGFDGGTYDFELLVGENGNSTSPGSTTYYFYIELS